VILISPSHSGSFRRINVCSLDEYQTPLGAVRVSGRLRDELCDEDDDIFVGDEGHFTPSGAYVQLPFLQVLLKDFNVVPIVMGAETPDMCRELGHAVGEVMYNQATLVVACANIQSAGQEELERLGGYLKQRDVSGLMQVMNSNAIQVEGKGAILVAMLAAMHRRASNVHLLELTAPANGTPGFIGAVITN
jgi:AmmeMemoRadiSam system protein B